MPWSDPGLVLKFLTIECGYGLLMAMLTERGIPLEICVTSNVCTGAVNHLESHPVRKLFDAGVPITLNTDDPALFRTTLNNEYGLVMDKFGFSEAELRFVAQNGFRYACSRSASSHTIGG